EVGQICILTGLVFFIISEILEKKKLHTIKKGES
ncbi:MAG: hypothetical protein QG670_2493, partial [Thermoproteota archaeon]|nr:hypothetical protein [Thermoproteota archaeon]